MAERRCQMEQFIHFISELYDRHTAEIFLAVLCLIIILMMINLIVASRCRRQIKYLGEKSRDVMRLALSQKATEREKKRGYTDRENRKNDSKERGHAVSKAEEELFGSVMREMFP